MQEIKQQIKELRPGLRQVAPLTWSIILGFGILNLVLGASLMYYPLGKPVAIITPYTPLALYGLIFVVLGVFMLLNLYKNNWKWLRRLLIIGVLIKSVWLFALVLRLFDGGNAIILALWLFLTHVQAMTYIHFIPASKGVGNDISGDRNSGK
ncbi:MAG: hypothetical protein WC426_13550 [Sulfuriferula sp.]